MKAMKFSKLAVIPAAIALALAGCGSTSPVTTKSAAAQLAEVALGNGVPYNFRISDAIGAQLSSAPLSGAYRDEVFRAGALGARTIMYKPLDGSSPVIFFTAYYFDASAFDAAVNTQEPARYGREVIRYNGRVLSIAGPFDVMFTRGSQDDKNQTTLDDAIYRAISYVHARSGFAGFQTSVTYSVYEPRDTAGFELASVENSTASDTSLQANLLAKYTGVNNQTFFILQGSPISSDPGIGIPVATVSLLGQTAKLVGFCDVATVQTCSIADFNTFGGYIQLLLPSGSETPTQVQIETDGPGPGYGNSKPVPASRLIAIARSLNTAVEGTWPPATNY